MRSIALTGVSGYLGRLLLRRLEDDPAIEQVVGIDLAEPSFADGEEAPHKLAFYRRDINDDLAPILSQHHVEAAVHLVYVLRPVRNRAWATHINLDGARSFLAACRAARVTRLLYPSSTSVYGARPDNPVPLTEEHPARPQPGFQYSWEKKIAEEMFQCYAQENPGSAVTVARGAPGLGPEPNNWIGRTLVEGAGFSILGYDPPLQYVHDDDFAAALHILLRAGLPGVFNIGGEGTVRYSAVAREAGRRRVAIPAPVIYPLVGLTWKLGLQAASPPEGLDYIRYPWVASSEKLQREAGFVFRHTSLDALRAFVAAWRASRAVAKRWPHPKPESL